MKMHFSRRTLMAALCGQGLASALDSPESEILNGKHTGMIVHSRRPIDLEARVELLDSWLTPIDRFYVRTHFYTPRIELADWNLKVDGLVDRPLSLGLEDLKRFEPAEVAVTLECAGNGRAFFDPRVLGTQWRREPWAPPAGGGLACVMSWIVPGCSRPPGILHLMVQIYKSAMRRILSGVSQGRRAFIRIRSLLMR